MTIGIVHGANSEELPVAGHKSGVQEFWSEFDVISLFGDDAVNEMKGLGIEPVMIRVYTGDNVKSWQARRVGNPEPSKLGLNIDPGTFTVSYQNQKPILLGNTIIFKLLARLSRRPNFYVDFDTLKLEVWKDHHVEDATITRAISRLRKQLHDGGIAGLTLEAQRHTVRLNLA